MIALLNLPIGSSIGLDGHTVFLKRDDFIGIVDIPTTLELDSNDVFEINHDNSNDGGSTVTTTPTTTISRRERPFLHFVTVRAAVSTVVKKKSNNNITKQSCHDSIPLPSDSAVTSGFFIDLSIDNSSLCQQQQQQQLKHNIKNEHVSDEFVSRHFIREFDPYTEEISSKNVNSQTIENLLKQKLYNQINPERVIPYNRMIQSIKTWNNLTKYITIQLLHEREIGIGEKIVPGSAVDDDDDYDDDCNKDFQPPLGGIRNDTSVSPHESINQEKYDGKSVQFPPIPIILSHVRKNNKQRRLDHIGTKHFLRRLNHNERTILYLDLRPSLALLEKVLEIHYHKLNDNCIHSEQLLLGDIQLSFCLFVYIHCFTSWIHWRDLIAMLCLVDFDGILFRIVLFTKVIQVWTYQLQILDDSDQNEFWSDDLTENNCVLDSFHTICCTISTGLRNKNHSNTSVHLLSLQSVFETFRQELQKRVPNQLNKWNDDDDEMNEMDTTSDNHCEVKQLDMSTKLSNKSSLLQKTNNDTSIDCLDTDLVEENFFDHDDEDDGPEIIPFEEVEASMNRTLLLSSSKRNITEKYITYNCETGMILQNMELEQEQPYRKQYPLLFAAMASTEGVEDIVMTCARVLDEKNDVSLVREAALYLETVESNSPKVIEMID